jgi:hypothetical protein
MFNKKNIFIGAIIALVTGVSTALIMYNKPHTDVSKTKEDITLEANTLLSAFENDEQLANKKYLEKILVVKGNITAINFDNEGYGIISLQPENAMGSILCHLQNKETTEISNLKINQTVHIKGICTGYLMDVILVKCILTN